MTSRILGLLGMLALAAASPVSGQSVGPLPVQQPTQGPEQGRVVAQQTQHLVGQRRLPHQPLGKDGDQSESFTGRQRTAR